MDWQLPSKASESELLWTLAKCEITSEILAVERVHWRAPAVMYAHTASSGGLYPVNDYISN